VVPKHDGSCHDTLAGGVSSLAMPQHRKGWRKKAEHAVVSHKGLFTLRYFHQDKTVTAVFFVPGYRLIILVAKLTWTTVLHGFGSNEETMEWYLEWSI
jgi:hypothetical protein